MVHHSSRSLLLGVVTGAVLSFLLTTHVLEQETSYESEQELRPTPGDITTYSHDDVDDGSIRRHVLYLVVLWDDAIPSRAIKSTWAAHTNDIRFYAPNTSFKLASESVRGHTDYLLLHLLKTLCTRDVYKYQWYIVLSGSTYVRTEGLTRLLRSLPLGLPVWLGREKMVFEWLGPLQYYCTGDIIVVNGAMLEKACQGAWQCRGDVRSEREVLEFNKCLHDITDLICQQLNMMNYISSDVDLSDAAVLHPLVNEEQLYYLHNVFLAKDFNKTLAKIMTLEQTLQDNQQKKLGRTLNMTYLDAKSLYLVSPYTHKLPRHGQNSKDKMTDTSHHLAVDFDHDSALHCVTKSGTVLCCAGVLLPSVIVSLLTDKYITTMAKVNFILPVTTLMASFQRFMIDFENSFLSRRVSRRISLLVVLFSSHPVTSNDIVFASSTLVELYQKKYPDLDIRLVWTDKPISWGELYHQALLQYATLDLLFFANTFMKFSMQFINSCISNTVDGHQVYFPSLFSPFDPISYQKSYLLNPYASRLQIDLSMGAWLSPSPNIACVFVGDLISLLEIGKGRGEISLLESVSSHRLLSVFSAAEPGAVHLWRRHCKENELTVDKTFCDSHSKSSICKCGI